MGLQHKFNDLHAKVLAEHNNLVFGFRKITENNSKELD